MRPSPTTIMAILMLFFLAESVTGRHIKILLPGAAQPLVAPPPMMGSAAKGACKIDKKDNKKLAGSCGPDKDKKMKKKRSPVSCGFCDEGMKMPFSKSGWARDEDPRAEALFVRHLKKDNCKGIDIVDASEMTRERFLKVSVRVSVRVGVRVRDDN